MRWQIGPEQTPPQYQSTYYLPREPLEREPPPMPPLMPPEREPDDEPPNDEPDEKDDERPCEP